jgi:hypothetical protein
VNRVERIDVLAVRASDRPWRGTEEYGGIITDGASLNHMEKATRQAYGGGLICESVVGPDKDLICELVNAWPQIRAALVAAKTLNEAHEAWGRSANGSNAHLVAIARQEAAHVAAERALAPLFGEIALAVREDSSVPAESSS